jgi:hypothetical protein
MQFQPRQIADLKCLSTKQLSGLEEKSWQQSPETYHFALKLFCQFLSLLRMERRGSD